MTTPRFGRTREGRAEVWLTEYTEWSVFTAIADKITQDFGGEVSQKLHGLGLDRAYWDIKVMDREMTLHLDQSLGIFLTASDPSSDAVVHEIGHQLVQFLAG